MSDELSQPSKINGISKSLGIEMKSFGDGVAVFEVTVTEKHLNKGGVAFGGLHASLLDSSMGAALVSTLKVDEWCATGNLTINYLEASFLGDNLISTGRIVRRGKTLAHLFGEIIDENGKIHANATGIWNIWSSKPHKFSNKNK
ncbi:MAG: hypothetical protein CMB56_002105 [Methanobacteriota archaeon]|nr:MAG: hypothetical protein CMB56_002105 [Euryarchaeota archaeon]|tara:strand:+ start:106 stop:537 length:432 start_codon:yes stop_codon:yes gene_type:complete